MKSTSTKVLAFASALAIGAALSGTAQAQVESVTAQLITSSAITSTYVSDLDFGEYLIQFTAGDTPVLTLTNDGSVAVNQTGSVANGSQVVQITAPATEGVVNVQIPAPGLLDVTASNFVDFADGGLALDDVSYRTATQNGALITAGVATGAQTVTVLAGSTDEAVTMGGNINVTATPADATHSATFDVTFTYP
ncbi:MAG: hypothetical protein H6861_02775 [Rhodospirillales bacterium]|nr:hypothetical protein [Rhodospirillales bacterium]